jgi:arylsulfatase A-like enzyme
VLENGQWRRAIQGYLASISFADAQLGRLLDALDASLYEDNTVIVLWSDHGFHLGERDHWEKFTLWERSTRVTFMITAPGVTTAGTRCGEPVSLLDVYPTLNELCGLPKMDQLSGLSLLPQLRDPTTPRPRPIVTTWNGSHAVRDTRWRYILYGEGGEELYDHAKDPGEWNNLADDPAYADKKAELEAWLKKIVPSSRAPVRRG